jgi:ABC-type multidrug transport system fused ATPase/permease subunit
VTRSARIDFIPLRLLLFNGSIIDDIAFGIADSNPLKIEHAARLVQAWDFIGELPRGLATAIGGDRVRLSGGQRQRIALAPALLRDPCIYVFDETTSMYDLEGEAAFVESCIEALASRTVIIVMHGPASLALADRIVHLTALGPAAIERGN